MWSQARYLIVNDSLIIRRVVERTRMGRFVGRFVGQLHLVLWLQVSVVYVFN